MKSRSGTAQKKSSVEPIFILNSRAHANPQTYFKHKELSCAVHRRESICGEKVAFVSCHQRFPPLTCPSERNKFPRQ